MRIRCPHCQSRVDAADDQPLAEISCPSCGSSFNLIVGSPTESFGSGPGRKLGHFELIEQVGMGHFGSVWKARDVELDRVVAVKIPRKDQLTHAETEQFVREARAAAQLKHPGIVPVHEVGREGDTVYIVSDYVEGATLAEWLTGQKLTPREAAELCAEIADALHDAHLAGVIHRDLKPGNVMMNMDGEPHIMDFGLARRETGEITMTREGHILGTPAYMSPEQARGEAHSADRRTDIYSLGVILFELLTGELPFRGETRMLIVQILRDDPPSPRKLKTQIPRDLETICLHCLHKDPSRRYASAELLADDLRRFLHGEPIRVRPVGRFERAAKWARRQPALALALAAIILTLVAGTTVSTIFGLQAQHRAQGEADAKAETMEKLRTSYLAQAQARRLSGTLGQRYEALEVIRKAAQIRPGPELRDEAIACMALVDLRVSHQWDGNPYLEDHLDEPWSKAFDSSLERYARLEPEGGVSVRRVADDKELLRLPGSGKNDVGPLRFSRDGRWLLVTYGNDRSSSASIWDVDQRKLAHKIPVRLRWRAFDFTPDNERVVIASNAGSIHLFDIHSGEEVERFSWPHRVDGLHCDPTGTKVAFTNPTTVHVVDLTTGSTLVTLAEPGRPQRVAWHPAGRHLAYGTDDGSVRVWDTHTGKVLRTMRTEAVTNHARFNPAGDLLATYGWDEVLRLWDPFSGELLLRLDSRVAGLQFSSDGRRLAAGMPGKKMVIWEVTRGYECRAVGIARGCDFSPDGRLLCADSARGFKFFDVRNWKQMGTIPRSGHASHAQSAMFFPDGNSLITDGASAVHRWPIRRIARSTIDEMRIGPPRLLHSRRWVGTSALSRDGSVLATSNRDGMGHVLHLAEGSKRIAIKPHSNMFAISVSPDGKWVATGTWHGTGIKVWNSRSGEQVADLPVEGNAEAVFTPDGRWLLTGNVEAYRFWETGTWKPGRVIPREQKGNTAARMAFSPDGKLLALNISMYSVQIHDSRTHQAIAALKAGPQRLVAFSPDGTQLAVNDRNGLLRVWDLRAIRRQLRAMKLDWDLPPFPPPPDIPERPLRIVVEMGVFKANEAIQRGKDFERKRKLAEAEEAYRQALKILGNQLDEFPEDSESRYLAGVICNSLGSLLRRRREFDQAQEFFLSGIGHGERLVRDHPQEARYLHWLGGCLMQSSHMLRSQRALDEAVTTGQRAIELIRRALQQDASNTAYKSGLQTAYRGYASTCILRKDHVEAAQAAELLAQLDHAGLESYGAATYLARCALLARQDVAGKPKDKQPELAERYAARSVELLRDAQKKGYRLEALETKSYFAALIARDDFKRLLAETNSGSQSD